MGREVLKQYVPLEINISHSSRPQHLKATGVKQAILMKCQNTKWNL